MLGVGLDDTRENLSSFQEKFGLSFDVLFDKSGESKSEYKLTGFPESFFVDRQGRLQMIPDPEEGGMPVVRIVGPRNWDSANSRRVIEELLNQQSQAGAS